MIEQNPPGSPAEGEPLEIDFLYWEGCPAYREALKLLETVLDDEDIAGDVRIHRVDSDDEAAALRFPGSPTIRVAGKDIDEQTDPVFGLSCRVYNVGERMSGVPPRETIVRAILAAVRAAR